MRPLNPIRVGLLELRSFENLLARDHHAHVDDVVVVAGEHDADDVLADVVDVALDGRQDDLALRLRDLPGASIAAFSASMNGKR
jgi:hypothetical protein